jgi:sulfate transport system ATP-binding protein
MSIEVRGIWKAFGSFTALRDVSLEVKAGELMALLGPSGSGKTTLLRLIAGLEACDTGVIHFEGEDATDRSARDRRVGFVFQHYALFRHMNVFDNVAFGLNVQPRDRRPPETAIRARVNELLDLVKLGGLARRMPTQLSGGERQRVALARALAVKPRVLLLDEPFGALDAGVRRELRRWLRNLHDELGLTSLFVTHDQDEALELADRIAVVNQGRVEQVGAPDEVYRRPATPFVFGFLGEASWLETTIDGRPARIGFRPEEVDLSLELAGNESSHRFAARVHRVRILGPRAKVELVTASGAPIQAEISAEGARTLELAPGLEVVAVPREPQVCFETNDG